MINTEIPSDFVTFSYARKPPLDAHTDIASRVIGQTNGMSSSTAVLYVWQVCAGSPEPLFLTHSNYM